MRIRHASFRLYIAGNYANEIIALPVVFYCWDRQRTILIYQSFEEFVQPSDIPHVECTACDCIIRIHRCLQFISFSEITDSVRLK